MLTAGGAFALTGKAAARKTLNLSIIIKGGKAPRKRGIKPVHPGLILAREFMRPSAVTQYMLVKGTGLSPIHVSLVVRGERTITAETALRLG